MNASNPLLKLLLPLVLCLCMTGSLAAGVTNDLAFYVPFTANMDDAQGGKVAHVSGDATRQNSGGIAGGYLQLQNSTSITPEQFIDFEDVAIGASDFSVSIWVRSTDASAGQAEGDVAFFSNKDWDSGGNQGWVLGRAANDAIKSRFQWNFRNPAGDRDIIGTTGGNTHAFQVGSSHILVILD